MMLENVVWAEKFRPKNLEECFLPPETREYLNKVIEDGDIPHLLFTGSSGIGKTTVAMAIANQLGYETMKVNSSLNGGIDTLRVEIQQFASTLSMNGKRKVVIMDEADGITAAAQGAFRAFIDEFGSNVLFIFTANFKNRIIEPLQSRLTPVNFLFNKKDRVNLAKGLFNFIVSCIKDENVEYDVKAVQKFILDQITQTNDIRVILSKAQKIAKTGIFNLDTIIDDFSPKFDEVIEAVKDKNFSTMRKWVGENSDIDATFLYRHIYDNFDRLNLNDSQTASIIGILNEHQYKHNFVADKEINLVSCLAEISSII